ncbi:MAG TPA: linear amide C-N hydrolase [Thermoanaerobaculia bacterium]|nr:linear amide C-N hydrolase [Thermoanaerobaculia bacterium]
MKRSRALALVLAGALAALPVSDAGACTTFCLKKGERAVFGKNYDWMVPDGLVIVNKRGVSKAASITPPEKPAKWTSKFGSVTFNQYGREQPSGGMNERGLAIELMWLDETRYPDPDGRPVMGCLDWIQYQLDTRATVAEVVRHAGDVRVSSMAKIHFLVCDKGGSCATVEFLDGKPVVHTGANLPMRVLTNDTYRNSLSYLQRNPTGANGPGSLARFGRAAARVGAYTGGEPVAYAFETLAQVAQGDYTQWSIVYDLPAGRVHWRTQKNPRVRSVALADFNFSCGAPVKILDIHQGQGKVAALFTNYTVERNRELVEAAFRKTPMLAEVPPEEIEMAVRLPEATTCTTAGRR